MNKAKELILHRFPKFVAGNLLGTLVDTLVLWVFSHFVFHNYVGKVIISPIISFEFAVFSNFVFSYYMTWKDRISHRSGKSFSKHYGAYNASCTGGFLIKMGMLLLIQALTKWDVVICNLFALNDAILKFRRYEDASLTYTGVNRHASDTRAGFMDSTPSSSSPSA